MPNPENRPTSRILPDGRRMPTFEGLRHTPSAIGIIAEKAKRPKSRKQVIGQSVVWERIKPLAEQQLPVDEIVTKTGLTKEQVRNALSRKNRPLWHQVHYSNPETANERRRALKGKRQSIESRMKKAIVWREIGPLYFRGALVREIVSIAGVDGVKVRAAQARNNRRPEATRVEPFGGLDLTARRKRARRLRETLRMPPSEDEKKDLEFAQKLFEAGFFTFDIKIWEKLHDLYGKSKRPLPESFTKRLRLEVFLNARLNSDNGNKELMDKYVEWGLGIDGDWFSELAAEEEFITRRIVREKRDRGRKERIVTERDGLFLDKFLKIRKEYTQTGDMRVLDQLVPLLKQDPTITERLAPQMAEIVKATPIKIKGTGSGGIFVIPGEMSMADIMGSDSR